MKKYCLVSFCNIYVLPYARKYIDAILASGAECDLIYWDRDAANGENDVFYGCNKFCYQRRMTPESSSKDKLLGYIEARQFIIKNLQKTKYDGIFFLHTHAAVACWSILRKDYKNKYIVDVRDYSLENYGLYRKIEKNLIQNSYATVISSPAYKKFLPKNDYVISHNYTCFSKEDVKSIREANRVSDKPIEISFVGTIRFVDMNKKMLKLFSNDNRFKLNFFGIGSEILEDFCRKEKISNVSFYGRFESKKTLSFYRDTDIINNLYGNNNCFLDYALSNKLYHAGQLHIPILVCPGTYMEEISTKYNIGFVFDINNSKEPDRLYSWYSNLDRKELAKGCEEFISLVQEENKDFEKIIERFLYRG